MFRNTLQVFITDKCNIRCEGCFVDKGKGLGKEHMTLEEYKSIVSNEPSIEKIVLLGGEPSMHPNLKEICDYNRENGLDTTIYTNGYNIANIPLHVNVRLSVSGKSTGAKSLDRLSKTIKNVNHNRFSVRLGLDQSNKSEIFSFASKVEDMFGDVPILFCRQKRIDITGSYAIDTDECLSGVEYISIIEDFLDKYNGNISEVHVTKQGYISGSTGSIENCRFSNVFRDGTRVTCPLDLGLIGKDNIEALSPEYGRCCNKNNECLLQKIVLTRRQETRLNKNGVIGAKKP